MTPTTRPTRWLRLGPPALAGALLVAFAAAVLLSAGVEAGESHAKLKGFQLSGRFDIKADGKLVPGAKIYHSSTATAYLVVSDDFDTALLVLQRTGCVETVKKEELEEQEDGKLDLVRDAEPCELGRFQLKGADVVFTFEEEEVRLTPKGPLIGTHYSSRVVEHSPEYGRAAKVYRTDPAKMGILAACETEARVQIFFGSWCSFCNRFLPNTLKVEEELKEHGTKITFEFHGLPKPPAAWATKESRRMRVRKLPTGFIFVDGKQVGRLEGNDWMKPEVALARYLR